ncbi:MAG: SCO family protein [Planctomycetes bacterium]|nr:SCO family protein [Planctomycetota bacterium]
MYARCLSASLLAALGLSVGAGMAAAQTPTPLPIPEELRSKLDNQVGIEEKLGDRIPLDLNFRTPEGAGVTLGDYFLGDGRPVVLTFNYADCPSLCITQLDGLAQTMADVKGWSLGDNYRVITIGLDPTETPERTAAVRDRMAGFYAPLSESPTEWAFLTGSAEDVQAVADAVGFRYTYDESSGQYLHGASLMLITPDGRVARYLSGLRFPGQTFRLALAETADGSLRSTTDKVLLFCFAFDPTGNSYVLAAWNFTRLFLAVFALALGAWLLRMFRQGRRPSALEA